MIADHILYDYGPESVKQGIQMPRYYIRRGSGCTIAVQINCSRAERCRTVRTDGWLFLSGAMTCVNVLPCLAQQDTTLAVSYAMRSGDISATCGLRITLIHKKSRPFRAGFLVYILSELFTFRKLQTRKPLLVLYCEYQNPFLSPRLGWTIVMLWVG